MKLRRAVIITVIAALCALATPTRESIANAACWTPKVRVTQYWYTQSCSGNICLHVLTLAGESGVDCDGNAWSWGDTSPSYRTYRLESCPQICE
jgi:hypothetical protein